MEEYFKINKKLVYSILGFLVIIFIGSGLKVLIQNPFIKDMIVFGEGYCIGVMLCKNKLI